MTVRYLIVADQSLGGTALNEAVDVRAHAGATIHLLVPATPGHDHGQIAIAVQDATRRLRAELDRLAATGIAATGEVGEADPIDAIRQALAVKQYDAIMISTLPKGLSRWVAQDMPHRVEREFAIPVEWIEAGGGRYQAVTSSEEDLPRILTRHDPDLPSDL